MQSVYQQHAANMFFTPGNTVSHVVLHGPWVKHTVSQ